MKTSTLIIACAALLTHFALAEETQPKETAAKPAAAAAEAPPEPVAKSTVIYRQVWPDGRIVYADKALAGAKPDQTITVGPAIKGNLWTTEPSERRPVVIPRAEPTPVRQVASLPPIAKPYVPEAQKQAASLEVMRAEMLLEDAKKRQMQGIAPLPVELRDEAAGGPRYNQAYYSRQKLLARDVSYAEQELRKVQGTREKLR